MEENNRKGPGIFYAVTGVATLVVAIIGATFAFFAANAQDETTIQGNVASAGGLYLRVKPLVKTETTNAEGETVAGGYTKNLIPLDVNAASGKTSQFSSAMENACIDANKNQVCQIYAITVANKSTTSGLQVMGTLGLESEATNIMWKLIDVTPEGKFTMAPGADTPTEDSIAFNNVADELTGTKDHVASPVATDENDEDHTGFGYLTVDLNTNVEDLKGTTGAKARTDLGYSASNNALTYYVMVWLEETGDEQQVADATKTFEGTVSFSAVDAQGQKTGLTAVF